MTKSLPDASPQVHLLKKFVAWGYFEVNANHQSLKNLMLIESLVSEQIKIFAFLFKNSGLFLARWAGKILETYDMTH